MISAAGREYRDTVLGILAGAPRFNGPVELHMVLFPPSRRRYDLDNFRKAIYDAITHAGIWSDDSEIHMDAGIKGEPVPGGRIVLQIRHLEKTTIPAWALEGAA